MWPFLLLSIHSSVLTELKTPDIIQEKLKDFYDPTIDYSKFFSRMTDHSGSVLKLETNNSNIKFLATGDRVYVAFRKNYKECVGIVRNIEDDRYLVIFVRELSSCIPKDTYLRRGTITRLNVPIMINRIQEAAHAHVLLLKNKDDYYHQLNDVNNFLWNYDQEKVILANNYDAQIMRIRQEKERALKDLVTKRNDSISLQKELKFKIEQIEKDVVETRADTRELDMDRWNLDHDNRSVFELRPSEGMLEGSR
jgi:hypothetical protein